VYQVVTEDNSVSKMASYRLDDWSSVPGRAGIFVFPVFQISCAAYLVSSHVGTEAGS
jgi:hypothetical protein